MANRSDNLDATMRDIIAHRDRLVEKRGSISPERLQRLRLALASKFPVEMALFHATTRRDEMLSDSSDVLPASVGIVLTERLFARLGSHPGRGLTTRYRKVAERSWRVADTFPLVRLAAILALLASSVLLVTNWASRGVHTSEAGHPSFRLLPEALTSKSTIYSARPVHPMDTFSSSIDNQLTLRVSTDELIALQTPLLTGRYLPDRYESDLPLDLPVRQIFMDAEFSRTP